MNLPLINAYSPIGLDIGRCALRAMQLKGAKGRRVISASASIGRTQPDEPVDRDELARLSRVLTQQGFVGRKIVLAAPADKLMSAVLEMPPRASGAPYDMIVSQEFARLQGKSLNGGTQTSWWSIPQPARVNADKVMAVGCQASDTDTLLDELEICGFDVAAMDFGLSALVGVCEGQLGPPHALSAVLDIGWGSARLALVHGSVLVFDRTLLGSGLSVLHRRVGQSLGIEPEQADCLIESVGLTDASSTQSDERVRAVAPLLRPLISDHLDQICQELNASFEYASHQYPEAQPHSLVVAGGGGAVPGVTAYLDSVLQPTVSSADFGDLLSGIDRKKNLPNDPALLATATGLAGYYS